LNPLIPTRLDFGGITPDTYETTVDLIRLTGLPMSTNACTSIDSPLRNLILISYVYGGTIFEGDCSKTEIFSPPLLS
jgi:hypothetical protein